MAIGSGLAGQWGVVADVTYATSQAPTRFYRVSKAAQKRVNNTADGGGISAGQEMVESAQHVLVSTGATGDIEAPFSTNSWGLILQHIMGGTGTITQQGATAAWLQAFAPGDNVGKSFTSQVGVPNRGGTVLPYTILGAKITAATFACQAGGLLTIALTLDGQQVVETTALATASYPASQIPFHFGDLSVKLGTFNSEAAVQGVKSWTMTITRPQSTDDSYYANNATATGVSTKSEPIWNDYLDVSGSFDVDVVNKADFVDRFAANTPTSMIVAFTKTTAIASTFFPTISFQTPATFFGGDTPDLEDTGVTSVTVPFSARKDLTNGSLLTKYMSTDTVI